MKIDFSLEIFWDGKPHECRKIIWRTQKKHFVRSIEISTTKCDLNITILPLNDKKIVEKLSWLIGFSGFYSILNRISNWFKWNSHSGNFNFFLKKSSRCYKFTFNKLCLCYEIEILKVFWSLDKLTEKFLQLQNFSIEKIGFWFIIYEE